ncbi:glycosyltransferase family 2 protein [Thermanaerothrix sp.]|uniref:glycosyltransferase family 2 protein n=1 Tax=Thermanaerothrix sp. TaxID=2972675 RepID=UPI002ADD958B|nr:glycosyltransferase family 2 protein [Thermanaerothrix sp.]
MPITNSHPFLSIITPSLNQGKYLEEAIQSVKIQNYPAYEHIIVDGGSQDETLAILEKYANDPSLRWISEPDYGQSNALNKGFQMAKGDFIGWLNADDRYAPGCFHIVSVFLQSHPEVDVVYGDYCFIDKLGKTISLRLEIDFDPFILRFLHVLYIPSTATFFRRRIFDNGHYLREDFHYAMDYEFFLRLSLQGYKFAHIRQHLADFRWHGLNKSSLAPHKQWQEQERALQELDPLFSKIKNPIQYKILRYLFLNLARAKRTWLKLLRGSYWRKLCP